MNPCFTPKIITRTITPYKPLQLYIQGFLDCIFIIATMRGSVSEWISVDLNQAIPFFDETSAAQQDQLPLPHLSAKFLLGASHLPRADFAQMLACQVASYILRNSVKENRMVLVGFGLDWTDDLEGQRSIYNNVLEMLQQCKVW
ncbi:hypothetical protein T552_00232 [Pneumocystis carinii B80]|uniref:Proteasome assembly chaperone 3 n=1 Tax=Pneumocystis carinii (strain B80) TaxID=1408658 RepID=A0A0W4ZTA7_PNEC8|nr:hypothetical protein T552_00232 [Pneumocystis carinii B80]KTW31594.1 hypothetical protein T552_00232 [Pneumocystis carinii B80]